MARKSYKGTMFASITIAAVLAVIVIVSFLFKGNKEGSFDHPVGAVSKEDARYLKSFFDKRADYEAAFSGENVQKKDISAGIVSHHFLAKKLIARFFVGIGNTKAKKIILIGPDHYGKLDFAKYSIATTAIPWETPYGKMFADKESIRRLLEKNRATINDEVFYNEHSMYTLVPFVKKVFPDAEIVPLIVKNSSGYTEMSEFGKVIRDIIGEDSIMIVSSDFSHDRELADTKEKDAHSIEALSAFSSIDDIRSVQCDCGACMALLQGFLGDERRFLLLENKNSNDFGGQEKTVTSYISGYFLK